MRFQEKWWKNFAGLHPPLKLSAFLSPRPLILIKAIEWRSLKHAHVIVVDVTWPFSINDWDVIVVGVTWPFSFNYSFPAPFAQMQHGRSILMTVFLASFIVSTKSCAHSVLCLPGILNVFSVPNFLPGILNVLGVPNNLLFTRNLECIQCPYLFTRTLECFQCP